MQCVRLDKIKTAYNQNERNVFWEVKQHVSS